MTQGELSSKSVPVGITEDEVSLYDRQIRLWGLEAQQKMRNATILVVRLRGTATETIKNIALAGIGKLVILDGEPVLDEDLGAGFFYTYEDVGKNRAEAAKARIQSLNPLVAVEVHTPSSYQDINALEELVPAVDLVCATDASREYLIEVNNICRRAGKPFYAGGTYGLLGYIFCDLLTHEYICPSRSNASEDGPPKNVKMTVGYTPLREALNYRWSSLTKRQTKELNPAVIFTIMALWEFEAHSGSLPNLSDDVLELERITQSIITATGVNSQVLPFPPKDLLQTLSTTASHEFSPVCAVVGGFLAQDILKALAAREPPIANFFAFDGNAGGGTVCRMNMQ